MRNKVGIIAGITIFLFLGFGVVHAQNNNSEEKTVFNVGKNEIISDDVFAGADTMKIEGTIEGDLYAGAENIEISGVVTGDVLAAAGMVRIKGVVGGDVMAAAGTVDVQGATIKGSMRSAGGTVITDNKTIIGETLVFGAGEANIKGNVGRNVAGGAGTAEVDANVGRDVWLGASEISFGPNTQIGGNVKYASELDANIDAKARISGGIEKILTQTPPQNSVSERIGMGVGFKFWSYFSALLIGFILIKIFGDRFESVGQLIQKNPLRAFVWGFVSLFLAPLALFVIATTLIGIPLAIFLFLLFLFELYCAKIVVGQALGNVVNTKLKLKSTNKYLNFAVGLLLVYILTNLGMFEFLLNMTVLFLGFGAIILKKRTLLSPEQKS